jgi:hypothetical protein
VPELRQENRSKLMQYILTQEEYNELVHTKNKQKLGNQKELQDLCTKIADTMPIQWTWGDKALEPWGCIHTRYDWYCDDCPVQKICPETSKEWSK